MHVRRSVAAAVDDPLFYELRRGPFGLMFLVDDRTLVFLPEHFGQGLGHLTLLAQLMRKADDRSARRCHRRGRRPHASRPART